MKPNKKALLIQREVMEKRLQSLSTFKSEKRPPSGWLKAIRGALGMTAGQLGHRMNLDASGVLRLEEREAKGSASFEMVKRAAEAMNCKLVYAIVPNDEYSSLEEILDERALKSARILHQSVEHSMRLEKQGVEKDVTDKHIMKLAFELKQKMDPLLWETSPKKSKKEKQK